MAIQLPSSDDRDLLAKLKAQRADEEPKKSPYYYEGKARELMEFLLYWEKEGFKECLIQASVMGTKIDTIKNQVHGGKQWFVDHAEKMLPDPEERMHMIELMGNFTLHKRDDGMLLRYSTQFKGNAFLTAAMFASTHNVQPAQNIRASLQSWVDGNPRVKETWGQEGLRLSDDDIEWFQQRRKELQPAGIIMTIMPTAVKAIVIGKV
jgi:hypothetical protein